MEMYKILLEAHSGLRFIVLILLIIAIIIAFLGWLGAKKYSSTNRKINLFTLISTHIQFLLGLTLYFVSPLVKTGDMATAMKDDNFRYWTVEHIIMMIIAIALITVGHSKSKKVLDDVAKHRSITIFFSLALIIIIAAILMSGRPLFGMSR